MFVPFFSGHLHIRRKVPHRLISWTTIQDIRIESNYNKKILRWTQTTCRHDLWQTASFFSYTLTWYIMCTRQKMSLLDTVVVKSNGTSLIFEYFLQLLKWKLKFLIEIICIFTLFNDFSPILWFLYNCMFSPFSKWVTFVWKGKGTMVKKSYAKSGLCQ